MSSTWTAVGCARWGMGSTHGWEVPRARDPEPPGVLSGSSPSRREKPLVHSVSAAGDLHEGLDRFLITLQCIQTLQGS